jgi:uncharacterized membrane protein YuzA (DUF378 family)
MFSRNTGVKERLSAAGVSLRDKSSEKLSHAKGSLRNKGSEAADALDTKEPNTVDKVTAAALFVGVASWITTSLFNFDLVQAVARRKSFPGRAAYGFLGVSALWAAMRGARR